MSDLPPIEDKEISRSLEKYDAKQRALLARIARLEREIAELKAPAEHEAAGIACSAAPRARCVNH